MTFLANSTSNSFRHDDSLISVPEYRSRFLSKVNHSIYSISIDDIQYFTFENNATVIITNSNRTFVIDYSLDQLERSLDPKEFFRINRRVILKINSIKKMNLLSKSRIEVILKNEAKEIVSRSKTVSFKIWLEY